MQDQAGLEGSDDSGPGWAAHSHTFTITETEATSAAALPESCSRLLNTSPQMLPSFIVSPLPLQV